MPRLISFVVYESLFHHFSAVLISGVLSLSFTALQPVILLPTCLFSCWYSFPPFGVLYSFNGGFQFMCTSIILKLFFNDLPFLAFFGSTT